MMLLLPRLRSLRSAIVEEIFFSSLTGSVQIWNVISIVLRMDTLETMATAGKYLILSLICLLGHSWGVV